MATVPLNDHGQPLSLGWNAHRRTERDISELLGLMKGMLADGIVSDQEAQFLRSWIGNHPDGCSKWPVSAICQRLERVFADNQIDEDERTDLKTLLESIVGGQVTMELKTDDGAAMPFDDPIPAIVWPGQVFVLTGTFAYGTRRTCEHEIESRGGQCGKNVTLDASFLVVGTFSSRDWVHTSFGRKIQKAVDYRERGVPVHIIGEDHWAQAL